MTVTTVKPAGTTSKLFGLTEGAHLPARRQYLRWVQFKGARDAASGAWAPAPIRCSPSTTRAAIRCATLRSFPGHDGGRLPDACRCCMRLGLGERW